MNEPKQWADPSAWCILGTDPPRYVWGIIRANYVEPLRRLRELHGITLVPSGRSCYRPPSWEVAKGRPKNGLHTFPPGSLGACDLVMDGGGRITAEAVHALRLSAPFARICHYPSRGFVHVDYGGPGVTRLGRSYFEADPSGAWRFVGDMDAVNRVHLS